MNRNSYMKYCLYNDLIFFIKKIIFEGFYFYNIVLLCYFIKYIYIYNFILNEFSNYYINNKIIYLKKKINKKNKIFGKVLKKIILRKKKKTYDFILRLKKKNLFLTFLDQSKNVLLKNNIGSFGYKKKVKFTGFALENSSLNFCKKVRKVLKLKLISNLKVIWDKLAVLRDKYLSLLKKIKIYKFNFKEINLYFKYLKNFSKKNFYNNIIKYRKYGLFNMYSIKKFGYFILDRHFSVVMLLKNNIKYWAFNYIIAGISKGRLVFSIIKDKRPITHSLGFRLKKQRRV